MFYYSTILIRIQAFPEIIWVRLGFICFYFLHGITPIMSGNDSSSNGSVKRRNKPSDSDPLPREKLPQDLQKLVDNEESLLDHIYDGT